MVSREKEIHECPRLCYSGFMRCTALMKRVMLLMGPSGKPKVWYQRSGDKTMDLDERYLHRKMWRQLQTLMIWNICFTLPRKLGKNQKLISLDASGNRLVGPIPRGLCAECSLAKLILFINRFTGEIPPGSRSLLDTVVRTARVVTDSVVRYPLGSTCCGTLIHFHVSQITSSY